jgi:hypothetical protein
LILILAPKFAFCNPKVFSLYSLIVRFSL